VNLSNKKTEKRSRIMAAAQRNGNRRGQQPANALFLTRHDATPFLSLLVTADAIKGTSPTPQQDLVRVMNAPQLYVGQEARFGGIDPPARGFAQFRSRTAVQRHGSDF
jgi:hypothetical protein